MLPSQQFCVKWNSYSSNLQSVFPRLLNSEHFVDITLACEGQMIKCHKVVLSACSTYFEKLLVHNPCQHPIIFMKDMKHWEVQALVDFMYKGEVNVSQEELNSLLVAAEALQIRGLCGSDSANRQQEGLRQPTSPSSKVPNVSLPNDIVLSGSTSLGPDSPLQKKRKFPNDDIEPLQSGFVRISGVSSLSGMKASPDSALGSQATGEQLRPDGTSDEFEEELKEKLIKQEVDMEDSFVEGEGDIDVQEDEAVAEQQEDSDSNNREDHSNPLLDQPGPSGLATNSAEKAATGGRWTGPVATVVSSEVELPTRQHLSSFTRSQLHEIPFSSSWCGNVAPTTKLYSNQSHLQHNDTQTKVYSEATRVNFGQIRVRECFPSAVQLESRCETDAGVNGASVHYPCPSTPGSSRSQIFEGSIHSGSHSVRPVEVFPRSAFECMRSDLNKKLDNRQPEVLLDSNYSMRSERIGRRRTEEEKAIRKLEMARLRQRRFRAKIRLMREAGLPVIKRDRKRKEMSETDNTPS